MQVGSKGVQQLDLVIPQRTSIYFVVVVKDEETGQVVDYSAAEPHMKLQTKEGKKVDLDECVSVASDKITVFIPATKTAELAIGKYSWDLMMEVTETQIDRICYGMTTIVDTYAMDGE